MKKAGGIIALIAGIFCLIAAISTFLFGGIGLAVDGEGADTVVLKGVAGIILSFLIIIFGALGIHAKKIVAGIMVILSSAIGLFISGGFTSIFMVLALVSGLLILLGTLKERKAISREGN